MVRPTTRLHGHPHGLGVTWRNRRKPWLVKFKRDRKSKNLGSYFTLREANVVAEQFLRNESNASV